MIGSYPPDELFKALDIIKSNIEENNILKTARSIRFKGSHFDSLHESIQNAKTMIQLELTERCNLRCAYCIYNTHYIEKRNHGNRDMTIDTAFKAIDLLARSSGYKNKVGITFYGGEPLLCFPLIKSCIQYARSLFKDKDLGFSITTNATLLTRSMVSFFLKERVGIVVSIDGPQDIHDEYRKDITGHGSFQRTLSALKMLVDAYGDDIGKLFLSMVYSPPFSHKRISRMAELWDLYPWLPRNIVTNVSYAIGFHPTMEENMDRSEVDFSLREWAEKRFITDYQKGKKPHPIAAGQIEKELVHLWKRPVHANPTQEYFLNGCCVPAVRKHYVAVDGTFILCERIGLAPAIGDIDTGINVDAIKAYYVDEYAKQSLHECTECWAVQLCGICYIHSYQKGKFNIQRKNINCTLMRASMDKFLSLYCRLLEINCNGLEYLSEMTIS